MLSKEQIGRDFWEVAHAIPEGLHDPPTPEEQRAVTEWLKAAETLYPCTSCRPGFAWILHEHPPDFTSRASLARSLCEWHNSVSVKLGKRVHDCGGPQAVKCGACSRALMDSSGLDGKAISTLDGQRAARGMIERLAAKFGVPVPKVIKFEQNGELCPGTSCTIMDATNPVNTTRMYLNPEQHNFSPRSVYHEFYHYMASVLGREKVKGVLGADFDGDPDSEAEADRFAFKEMGLTPEIKLNMDSAGLKHMEQEVKVLRQEPSNVFSGLDPYYRDLANLVKISPQDANEAWTPEILGTGLQTAYNATLTPLGAAVFNVVTSLVLMGAGTISGVGQRDRVILNQWAAHHGTTPILLANPGYFAQVTGGARSAGRSVASGRAMDALNQMVKPPTEVYSGFKGMLNDIQSLVGPLAKGGARGVPSAGHAVSGEQLSPGGSYTSPPVFS